LGTENYIFYFNYPKVGAVLFSKEYKKPEILSMARNPGISIQCPRVDATSGVGIMCFRYTNAR
jgi:hypothetical protein